MVYRFMFENELLEESKSLIDLKEESTLVEEKTQISGDDLGIEYMEWMIGQLKEAPDLSEETA